MRERDLYGGGGEDGSIYQNGFEEVGCDAGNWIDLAQGRTEFLAYVKAAKNPRVPQKPISYINIFNSRPTQGRVEG